MPEHHPPEISRTRVDSAGRIVIPAELRAELGIEPGCDVFISADTHGIHLQTFEQAVRFAQEVLAPYRAAGTSVVDELISERRAEARQKSDPPKRPRGA